MHKTLDLVEKKSGVSFNVTAYFQSEDVLFAWA